MREWRSRWSVLAGLLLVVGLFASAPTIAEAAAKVVLPNGWGESAMAAPEAQRRASRWQAALGLALAQVMSAAQDDRFAETVAAFERREPVPERTFADEAAATAALTAAVANLVGDEGPEASELLITASGERVVWGRWIVDDLVYECALAPSGGTTTVVVAAVLASEAELHRATLAKLFRELDGVTPPMPRFSLLAWRLGSLLVWIALGLGLHATMLQISDRDGDHGEAGKRASTINLALVVIGTAVAAVTLRGRELALIHVGSSVAGLSVWIGVAGIVVVGVHFLISSRLDRGQIQSAPMSGAFASGIYSSAEVIRSSSTRSGVRRSIDDLESSANMLASASQSRAKIIIDEAEREP